MNARIAMRGGFAVLLTLSLAACDVEQFITFVLDPTGDLVGIETPVSWDESNTENFEQFDAGEASQRVVLWNVDWDDMAANELVIKVFDASDAYLATSSPIAYVVDDTGTDLELEIMPGVSQLLATSFVQGLPINQPDARRLEFTPHLSVDRLDPNIPVIACAEVFYGGFSLDLKCEVLF